MNLRTPPSLPQPLIGVTGQYRYGHEVGRLPAFVGQEPIEVFLSPYIRSVAGAGGTPVLLTREADPVAVVDRLDALVLAGGEDVDPGRYGGIPTEFATVMDPGRDAFEIGLFEAALVKGIPVLGICRGCQLINVARGGTLVPHLSASDGQSHSFYGYPGNHRPQMVNVTEDSELSRVLGARISVNSYHHQAVLTPGEGVVVSARALDGVVEGIEMPDADVVAVQWHPEMFGGDPLFDWLVERAVDRTRGTDLSEHSLHAAG
ncbi:putative glutamine amidotransferase [Nocardioides aromaticivorans]|uniref:Putative glutamine amidotransferase n=1 Tax=Nocardioides aromaticivorans TaxID=200618 RepID=A0A7Z0CNP7_9ACTN|nr:gamma-glutamyl-gamma-aminobutyrate hydrolase family protein [Nocardioides aromaticivorans]NYI45047.1 putative glutamine amidotransferase [Nocardioides aromaticivorans]